MNQNVSSIFVNSKFNAQFFKIQSKKMLQCNNHNICVNSYYGDFFDAWISSIKDM